MNLIERIFSTDQFMPHGMCYEWNPGVIWLHVLSDAVIGLAYYSIPLTLIYFIRKRKDIAFGWMFGCFAVFILACGTTHLMEILNIWHPTYWLSGIIKAITAATSVVTAFLLIKLLPQAIALPSHKQMQQMNEALVREVEERRKAVEKLNALNRELAQQSIRTESANKELESFSYSISHDLRSPLRTMIGYAGAIEEDFSASLPDQARDYLDRISRAAGRLDRLIQDLLTYSRISTEEIKIQPVDLDRLVRDTIRDYPDLEAQSGHIQIEGHLPAVLGYDSGLAQIVANLIGNGLKFVRPGEKPAITIRAEDRGESARIWFIDHGIGISPANQARIFKIFEQLHSARQYAGTGIGLAVVKKTVERMGGTIGVESEENAGCRFWIELHRA